MCTKIDDTISIYDYSPRVGVKEIVSKSEWFNDVEYYIVEKEDECLIIKKCYMEIPKNALKFSDSKHFRLTMDLPNGTFIFDEDSNEDELVILFE